MSKNFIQDIVKKQNVKKVENFIPKFSHQPEDNIFSTGNIIKQKPSSNRYKIWFVALISVLFLLFAFSFVFAKAKVTVIAKTQNISFNQNLSAVKDSNTENILPFDLVVISGEENKNVKNIDMKDILTKAKGQIIIYNTFSSAPQTLSINTQLEGSNGKIYKTIAKVVVPGMTKSGIPGQIQTGIYGNVPGEEYNSSPLDFQILGFKGTPKYAKFKARSQGPIMGGMKGKYYKTSDADKDSLSAKLLEKVQNQTPPGFVLFKNAVFLNIDEDSSINTLSSESATGDSMVTIKGTFYGFLFDEKKLTKIIAEKAIDKYDGSAVHIPDIKNLTFSPSTHLGTSDKEISFADVKNLDFNLSGSLKIVWDVDSTKLVGDLLGKNKQDLSQILSSYPNITSANVTIRPFWKTSFPSKHKNIEVTIN